jgi:hypothetical protein
MCHSLFVDNWPALDVLVKGTSLQLEWRDLLLLLEDPLEDNFMLWVARVPSSSNVADHPSRGSIKELVLEAFQMRRACLSCDETPSQIHNLLKQTGVSTNANVDMQSQKYHVFKCFLKWRGTTRMMDDAKPYANRISPLSAR